MIFSLITIIDNEQIITYIKVEYTHESLFNYYK